jgi:hypothetical protein
LNESSGSWFGDDESWRSSCGASLILVGFDPRLNIFTVLEVRISGVLGTGRVVRDIVGDGRLKKEGSGSSIAGS